mmetsp:Transcript_47686/g.102121  ORF Transcript_47686/g.102121 Transcript_47686/m.102121 type:complete len:214 (+) Transcript_47686:923-1564(+)
MPERLEGGMPLQLLQGRAGGADAAAFGRAAPPHRDPGCRCRGPLQRYIGSGPKGRRLAWSGKDDGGGGCGSQSGSCSSERRSSCAGVQCPGFVSRGIGARWGALLSVPHSGQLGAHAKHLRAAARKVRLRRRPRRQRGALPPLAEALWRRSSLACAFGLEGARCTSPAVRVCRRLPGTDAGSGLRRGACWPQSGPRARSLARQCHSCGEAAGL